MHAKWKTDPKKFEEFSKTFLSKEFQTKLKSAVANPDGKTAKSVLRIITPILKTAGKKTLFGALERHAAAGDILAMGRRFGPASNFLTVAVDDVNSPTVFRLTFRSTNNVDWPALAPENFLEAMREGSTITGHGDIPIDCSWPSLAAAATQNPVAVAVVYKKLVYDIMSILVGLRPSTTSGVNNRTVKTTYRDWSEVGAVVGTPLAFLGVSETTARGSLHFHVGAVTLHELVLWLYERLIPHVSSYSNLGWSLTRTIGVYIRLW